MSERILVCGISSLIGRAVAEEAIKIGHRVYGTYYSSLAPDIVRLRVGGKIRSLYKADLTNPTHAQIVTKEVNPDIVVMLAAHAKNNPTLGEQVLIQNLAMIQNVGEALRVLAPRRPRWFGSLDQPRQLVFASSVLVTGPQDGSRVVAEVPTDDLPIPREQDYYVRSKIGGEEYVLGIASPSLHSKVVRFANITGPGREAGLIETDVASQVPTIKEGRQEGFELFNAKAAADFSLAEDAATGVLAVILRGVSGGIYNIASGEEVTAARLAQTIGRVAGLGESVPVKSIRDEVQGFARFSNEKLQALGWKRRFTFQETMEIFYRWYVAQETDGDIRYRAYLGHKRDYWNNLVIRPLLKSLHGWERLHVESSLFETGDIPQEWYKIRKR